ncbi:DNA helicase [Lithospermum erythrorhizon]|uniref:DNA helicase n=1 Tax=Lithospermum erythrorhizon TaxID=34254 RepID=A0AAV3QQN7_LITER
MWLREEHVNGDAAGWRNKAPNIFNESSTCTFFQLIAYFAKRMISKETLEKNHVMQRADDQHLPSFHCSHEGCNYQNVIAFTYRRDGMLVGCKYRSVKKRFWQMKGAEKIFYGVDDIKDADEIIIVEGEVDKLSMNEVGLCNCVSVPNGAPPSVSDKETSIEEDVGFQYLWKEKEYMEKASRIILATDGDIPGQALAKELARRVGIERCWQVCWPKKDEFSFCNDANEVLVNLGADALREAVKNAECYQMKKDN